MLPPVYRFSFLALASALAFYSVGPAMAQGEMAKTAAAKVDAALSKIEQACKKDLGRFCSQVTPGEGRIAFCMVAHEDKISDECFDTILDVGQSIRLTLSNVLRAAEACDGDIEKQCGSVEPGDGRIAKCLVEKQSSLSQACQAEVAGLKVRMSK